MHLLKVARQLAYSTQLSCRVPTRHTSLRYLSSLPYQGLHNLDFNNDPKKGLLKLPGYNCPIDEEYYNIDSLYQYSWDSEPTDTGFCHGFSSYMQMRRNLVRELHMIRVMDALTDKSRWDYKVFDEATLQKWKVEAMSLKGRLISERAWEWIVQELRWKAVSYWRTGYITTLETGSTIVKMDTLVEESLKKELQEAVKPLLEVSDAEKDWHPGSDGKVLNLVHPSLYPFVYGRTKILPDRTISLEDCTSGNLNEGVVVEVPETPVREDTDRFGSRRYEWRFPYPELWSTKFQWLPCEVEFVGSSGTEVKITSYINNLHPTRHKDLYNTIEKFISKSIEPWNEVLRWGEDDHPLLRIHHTDEIKQTPEYPPSIPYDVDHYLEPEVQESVQEEFKAYLAQPDNPDHLPIPDPDEHHHRQYSQPYDGTFPEGWEHNHAHEDVLDEKWRRVRVTEHPEPGASPPFPQWKQARKDRLRPKLQEIFRDHGLQVIVKLSSIELTPEKPEYAGGNWHLEGKMNEHIVATSIYYYDVHNVTESRLHFRQEANLDQTWDIPYDADNHGPIEDAYGARRLHDCPAIQDIGSVVTRQDRLLVFPNIVQHRVEPFKLDDPTRPGHRRFLVVWLVDPHYRVFSTGNVKPQQWGCWKDKSDASGEEREPPEWPMTRADAEQVRKDLMSERTTVMNEVEHHFERYNFCEH